jgi:hypothetical protein
MRLIHDSLVSAGNLDIAKPLAAGIYYVQIKALDGEGGESPASAPETFKIGRGILSWCTPCMILPLVLLLALLL